MRTFTRRLARIGGLALVFAAYALAETIAPTVAHADTLLVNDDSFYCQDIGDMLQATKQIAADDYPGYVKTMTTTSCGKAPKGTAVVEATIDGPIARGVLMDENRRPVEAYVLAGMVRVVDSVFILNQMAMACLDADDLAKVAEGVRQQNAMTLQVAVDFGRCVILPTGTAVTVKQQNDLIANVEVPLAGQVFTGVLWSRELR